MPMDNRVSYGTAVLLIRDDLHIALHKRKGAHQEGVFSFPGGWVDYGECAAMAAVREAKEEYGVDVDDVEFFSFNEEMHERWRDRGDGVQVSIKFQSMTLYFCAKDWRGEPRIMEPDKADAEVGIVWVPLLDEAKWPEKLFPGLRVMLRKLAFTLTDNDELAITTHRNGYELYAGSTS